MYSPRRTRTSFANYYDLNNSYSRELASRHGVHVPMEYLHHQSRSPSPAWRPKTAVQNIHMQANSYLPTHEIDRPPSQLGFRPAGKLAYRPPSQSGYRPGSTMMYSYPGDYRGYKYTIQDEQQIPSPEAIMYDEDEQIFVRKPIRTSPSPPIFRLGSHGAPWRHVKSVINSNGSHVCWIDGTVKQDENTTFPMYWNRRQPRTIVRPKTTKADNTNSYHERAKNGFKYWYQQNVPTTYTDYSKFYKHVNQITV